MISVTGSTDCGKSRVSFVSGFYNVINGAVQREKRQVSCGVDPATRDTLWPVAIATQKDLNDAVTFATSAFKEWSKQTIDMRKDAVRSFLKEFLTYEDEFTTLLIKEVGKATEFANMEFHIAVKFLETNLRYGLPDIVAHEDESVKIVSRFRPLGVVGAIIPWNFPLVLAVAKIVPSLIVGCPIIVKPSPFTPYSMLKFCEIAIPFFPPGVLQVLHGDDSLGPMIVEHPGIPKISFTGSIATGKKIASTCARLLKRVALELGGNDASIICPDVDIPSTAAEVAVGCFANSGQICVATKRVYVHEAIYDEFLTAFIGIVDGFKIGAGHEQGVMIPPVQNELQYEKLKGLYQDCVRSGYQFALGDGRIPESSGYFCPPTVLDNPPDNSRVVVEEAFGPIVPIQSWGNEREVVDRANDTLTGLGACVWSKDLQRAERIAQQIEVGSVWINSFEKPHPAGFLSGYKESGIGGEYGELGMRTYCNIQTFHYAK